MNTGGHDETTNSNANEMEFDEETLKYWEEADVKLFHKCKEYNIQFFPPPSLIITSKEFNRETTEDKNKRRNKMKRVIRRMDVRKCVSKQKIVKKLGKTKGELVLTLAAANRPFTADAQQATKVDQRATSLHAALTNNRTTNNYLTEPTNKKFPKMTEVLGAYSIQLRKKPQNQVKTGRPVGSKTPKNLDTDNESHTSLAPPPPDTVEGRDSTTNSTSSSRTKRSRSPLPNSKQTERKSSVEEEIDVKQMERESRSTARQKIAAGSKRQRRGSKKN